MNEVNAEPLKSPSYAVPLYKPLGHDILVPESTRRRVEPDTQEAVLLPAKLIIPLDEPSPEHQTTVGEGEPPE